MPFTRLNKPLGLISVFVVGFIVYGSLFPFRFQNRPGEPLAALLATWHFHLEHFGNLVGNVFLYVPLGLFGVLALGTRLAALLRLSLVILLGAMLCFSLELTQFYVAGRVSTFADIYPNVLGTALGAVAGLVVSLQWLDTFRPTRRAQPVPMLLLCVFLAYRLFPYVPSLDLHQYWQAVKPVVLEPAWTVYGIAHYTVIWLAVAALLAASTGAGPARPLLALAMLGVLAAKVVIVNNGISAAETIAAPLALVCWLAASRMTAKTNACVIALALAGFIVAERLQPFDFHAAGQSFGWIPFSSFLHGSMAVNALSFLEKCFLYGSLIWLLTTAGLALGTAGATVGVALLATSAAQTHLAGRSAEITDAMMALLITGLFALIARSAAAIDRVPPSGQASAPFPGRATTTAGVVDSDAARG